MKAHTTRRPGEAIDASDIKTESDDLAGFTLTTEADKLLTVIEGYASAFRTTTVKLGVARSERDQHTARMFDDIARRFLALSRDYWSLRATLPGIKEAVRDAVDSSYALTRQRIANEQLVAQVMVLKRQARKRKAQKRRRAPKR